MIDLKEVHHELAVTDDDSAVIIYRYQRKVLTVFVTAYGGVGIIRCGLRNPPGGVVNVETFEAGWRWLTTMDEELP